MRQADDSEQQNDERLNDDDVDMKECVDDDDTGFLKNEWSKNMVMKKLCVFNYPRMKYLLDSGFNLCLYGIGSKVDYVNYYVQTRLQTKEHVYVFNGFTQSCNMRVVVSQLKTWCETNLKPHLERQGTLYPGSLSLHEKVSMMKADFQAVYKKLQVKHKDPLSKLGTDDYDEMDMFESKPEPSDKLDVYLVIHSIDAGMLKSDDSQDLLAELASAPYVHLIVTMDHLCANRMWNNSQLDKFGFYMMQTDTFRAYDKEYINQPELFAIKNDN